MSQWVDIGGVEVSTTCFQTLPCLHIIRVGGVEKMAFANNIPHGGRLNDGQKVCCGYEIGSGKAVYGERCNIFGCFGKLK